MRRPYTNKLVIHHTVFNQKMNQVDAMDAIYRTHKAAGLLASGEIAYHHVLGYNWESFGRKLDTVGYHSGNWGVNLTSVAVAVMGNFEHDKLNAYQKDRLRNRLQYWMDIYGIKRENVKLHRDFYATACPGKNINDAVITDLIDRPRVPVRRTKLPRQK